MKTKLVKSLLFVLIAATSTLAGAQVSDSQSSPYPWQPVGVPFIE